MVKFSLPIGATSVCRDGNLGLCHSRLRFGFVARGPRIGTFGPVDNPSSSTGKDPQMARQKQNAQISTCAFVIGRGDKFRPLLGNRHKWWGHAFCAYPGALKVTRRGRQSCLPHSFLRCRECFSFCSRSAYSLSREMPRSIALNPFHANDPPITIKSRTKHPPKR